MGMVTNDQMVIVWFVSRPSHIFDRVRSDVFMAENIERVKAEQSVDVSQVWPSPSLSASPSSSPITCAAYH